MKRIFLAVAFSCLLPLAAGALTVEDIQKQIDSIVARIATLKAEFQKGTPTSTPAIADSAGQKCPSFTRALSFGSRGEDVRRLQLFLIEDGYLLSDLSTGYFGLQTEEALQRWQKWYGVVSSGAASTTGFGLVGPRTRAAILSACSRRADLSAPVIFLNEGGEVSTSTESGEVSDTSGGRAADEPPEEVSVQFATTSIRITSPAAPGLVTGGSELRISWKSTNPPLNSGVELSLVSPSGAKIGDIARSAHPSGVYVWKIPFAGKECGPYDSAIECISRYTSCEGGTDLCALPGGTYSIHAMLTRTAHATSAPFQVVGSALSGVVGALVAPPSAAPTPPPAPSSAAESSACTHQGYSYHLGETISAWCETGHCPGGAAGYITGQCSKGRKWCIPGTSYCATSLSSIDVSAYEARNAAPIGSGHASGCPVEGWRAYLTCTGGSCKTGYHICRGGSWSYDPNQALEL